MSEVDDVKAKIDIVEVISEFVPIKKSGRNWKGLCPFHGEKTPSFMVSQELQIYKCFGCQAGGDVFDFLMRIEGMEFGEALRTLAKRAGVILKERVTDTPTGRQKERLYEINHLSEEFYHYLLTSHSMGKGALEYVTGRGIKKEMVELFKIGFSPNMWDGLQQFMVGKKKIPPEELEAAGLVIRKTAQPGERGYYDRFRGRLVFPLRDHRGNTVGFSGRVIPGITGQTSGGRPTDGEEPKYINTPETVAYQKRMVLYGLDLARQEIKRLDQAILVEGELDMISSYQAGVENVVGVKGTAITSDQVRLLRRIASELVVALDADFAGDAAARRGIELADAAGFSIKVAKLKYGKDPDDCAQHSPDIWRESIAAAIPVYEYLMESAKGRYGVETAEGKRRVGRELIPIWARISDPIMRASLTHDLAKLLGVEEVVVRQEVEKARGVEADKEKDKEKGVTVGIGARKSRRELLEDYLLALGLQKDPKILVGEEVAALVRGNAARRILSEILTAPEGGLEDLRGAVPSELAPYFGEVMMIDLGEILADEEKWQKEFVNTKNELARLGLKEELMTLSKEIEQLENKGETEKLAQAQKRFMELLLSLKQTEKESVYN
jgi:DNA primase